jgi:hypothetical protein
MKTPMASEQMDAPPQNLDPRYRVTVLLGPLITFVWSVIYLGNLDLVEHLRLRSMDAVVVGMMLRHEAPGSVIGVHENHQ